MAAPQLHLPPIRATRGSKLFPEVVDVETPGGRTMSPVEQPEFSCAVTTDDANTGEDVIV